MDTFARFYHRCIALIRVVNYPSSAGYRAICRVARHKPIISLAICDCMMLTSLKFYGICFKGALAAVKMPSKQRTEVENAKSIGLAGWACILLATEIQPIEPHSGITQ